MLARDEIPVSQISHVSRYPLLTGSLLTQKKLALSCQNEAG